MNPEQQFLPGFDTTHLFSYYSNDMDLIKEMFFMTNLTLTDDLNKIAGAVNDSDIVLLRSTVHAVRPLFYILGLPDTEAEVKRFYALSLSSESVNMLTGEFTHLWQHLRKAQDMINEQCRLLKEMESSVKD